MSQQGKDVTVLKSMLLSDINLYERSPTISKYEFSCYRYGKEMSGCQRTDRQNTDKGSVDDF